MSAVRRLAVAFTFLAAVLMAPALTSAASAYNGVAGVTISANAVGQGCAVTLSGTNFFGTVTFSGAVTGTTTADANGNFSKSIDTSSLSQGNYAVTITDNVGDRASVSFTVQAKTAACTDNNGIASGSANNGGNNGGTGGLSNTGVAVIGIGTVGGILLAGGALMLVAGRRRQVSA